jgi:hypothetical protein
MNTSKYVLTLIAVLLLSVYGNAQSGVVSRFYSDFGGYWYSGGSFANIPDNSHNVLAFVYNGVTYSTGVNDALLNTKGVSYTASSFYALPAILTGAPGDKISVGAMLDGSLYSMVHTHPNVKNLTSENVLTDGIHGLNIGTGYTNLPAATTAVFNIQTIITSKIDDNEPDILVGQIAGPGGNPDVFKFVDASGNTVGNSVNVIFNSDAKAPLLSRYRQDQFIWPNYLTLTASTATPVENVWSSANALGTGSGGNGQIRMVAFKLSEFGITSSNYTQISSFTTIPSGTTDIAFVAYSNGSMNVPPSLGINTTTTSSVICSDINSTSNAFLSVRPYSSSGGALSYSWEVSTNAGTSWSSISNNAVYAGATTTDLTITGATVGYKYRATVVEAGTGYSSVSPEFSITSTGGSALAGTLNPTGFTNCAYASTGTTSLSVRPTGGTGSYGYQWSSSTTSGGTYTAIPGATSSSFNPDLSVAGTFYYKVTISSGCYTNVSTAATVIVNGGYISSVTNGQICTAGGDVSLSATATSGTVTWFANYDDASSIATGNTYSRTLSSTRTFYVSAVSGSCSSPRVAVVASVFSSSLALTLTATNTCSGAASAVSVYNSAISDGTYTLNYSFSGSNAASNGSAIVDFVNGTGYFNTRTLNSTGTTTLTISGVVTSSSCTVTSFTGNTASITVSNSNPSVSNFSLSATSACTNINSVATISSSSLASGTYLVTYNISGTNTVASTTAQMVFTAGSPGTGTFTLPLLSATGTNNVLGVTNIALLSSANCGTALSKTYTFVNNTTPILSAGDSFSACADAGSPVSITGSSSASYYSALAWSTSNGTGTFSSNTTGSALTSTTYSPTAADITRGSAYMTLTATANTGCTNVIKTITLTLVANAVGGSVSSNQTIAYNTQPSPLTVSGYTSSITRWEKSADPGFGSPTNLGSTSATLTSAIMGNITATTYIRAVITRGTCVENSTYATISISGSPTISSFTPVIASTGETVTITGTNFTGSSSVTFGGTAASSFAIVSSTSITAVVAAGSSGSVTVTNTNGSGSLSGFTYCTVTTPGIIISASATSICSGTSVSFSASITNGGSSPQYQWKKNGSNVGISSSIYTDAALVNSDVITCVLTSNANCVTSANATSNSIAITVSSNSAASITIAASATSICNGTSVVFSSSVTNPGTSLAYQWKKNSANVGTNSSSYTDGSLSNGDIVSCVLTSGSACVSSAAYNSNNITMAVYSSSWTGSISNEWNNALNWCSGTVPSGADNITISFGSPLLNIDLNLTGTLTLSGTATLNVSPGKTLSIPFGGVADFAGKLVTFKSDVTGSAQLGTVLGTLRNASNVVVERHIPPSKRAFRFFGSPVTTTTTIRQNWMEGATPGVVTGYPYTTTSVYNPKPGYGTLITGAGGNANGFDASQTSNPSMSTFNNTTGAWVTSTNTSATIAAGSAYRLLIRGDRSYNINAGTLAVGGETILRTTGTIAQGELTTGIQLPALSQAADGWSLVGNPYQAVVDMASIHVVKNNLTPYYYVWDPRVGTRGAYVSFNMNLPSNGSNNTRSGVSRFAQPGQAFFVQNTTAGSNSIVFKETAKGAASNKTSTFAKNNTTAGMENGDTIDGTTEKAETLQLQSNFASLSAFLYYTDSLAAGAEAMDAARVLFGAQFSDLVDINDGMKFSNLDETMGIKQGSSLLSMELRTMPDSYTKLPLNITQYIEKKYTMRLVWDEKLNTDTLVAYLRDKYTNKETEVKKTGNTDVEYLLDADARSSAVDRFEIFFKSTNNQVTAVINYDNGQYLKIYPNPVQSVLKVDFDLGQQRKVDIKLYDMTGRLVIDSPGLRKGSTLTMTGLSKGIYNVKVWGIDGKLLMTEKII